MSIPDKFYSGAGLVAPFLFLPKLLSSKRGRSRILERFGTWKVPDGAYTWFHGASMGEVRGLLPLMKKRKAERPDEKLLLTATSVTGLDAGAQFADASALLPFDSPFWINRALKGLDIRQLVIAETELWPSVISILARKGVPARMVNARMSKYSFPRYRRFRFFFEPLLSKLALILCSDSISASRFLDVGAPEEKVEAAGNTKYDSSPSVKSEEEKRELQTALFSDVSPIFVAGSLRPSEEDVIFPALASLHSQGARFNVIVAPRHQEKFDFFADRLKAYDLPFRRWSEKESWQAQDREKPFLLLDTFGMLEKCYSIARLAFIGASLVDIGGHNPLEASAYGTPVMMGPHTGNVEEVCESMLMNEALYSVETERDVEHIAGKMLSDPEALKAAGARGKSIWEAHQGTVERVYDRLFGQER